MSKKLPAITPREVVRILKKIGFVRRRQKGSHLIMRHPDDARRIVIPMHFSKSVAKGTLTAIIKQAGLTIEEFNELRKAK